jgi:hypothetical protein
MASIKYNPHIESINGRIGNLLLRESWNGHCVQQYTKPEGAPSQAQASCRRDFKSAQQYAAERMSDPLLSRAYRLLAAARKGRPTNSVLIQNFLKGPEIDTVETEHYHGRPGDVIRILTLDPVLVVSVELFIRDPQGALLEQAFATRDDVLWTHTATIAVSTDVTLEVAATNPGGSKSTKTLPLRLA